MKGEKGMEGERRRGEEGEGRGWKGRGGEGRGGEKEVKLGKVSRKCEKD